MTQLLLTSGGLKFSKKKKNDQRIHGQILETPKPDVKGIIILQFNHKIKKEDVTHYALKIEEKMESENNEDNYKLNNLKFNLFTSKEVTLYTCF